jgi:hypothetical protein
MRRFAACRLGLRWRWIRGRLNGYDRSRRRSRIWRRNRGRVRRCMTTDCRFRNIPRPWIAVTLPVPRQQGSAHHQQKQSQVKSRVALGRLVFQQVIQVAIPFVPQPQKRRTTHRDSDSLAPWIVRDCRRWRSKGSSAYAAEPILRIILLAALNASHCHGYRHNYTNSDATSA